MKKTSTCAVVVCGALSAAAAHAEFAVTSVTMTELGTLGGQLSDAYDINDAGTIVGYSADTLGASRGFYYSGGVMYQVGASGVEMSWAMGINNSGQIVGTWRDVTGDHAYRWQGGFITQLAEGAPYYLTVESSARAIADNGRIVGQLNYPHPYFLGFSASNMWLTPGNHFHLYPPAVQQEYASIVEDVDELGRAVIWDNYTVKSYLVNHFGPPASTYKAVPPPPAIAGYDFSFISALGLHENNGVVGAAGYYSPSNFYASRAYYWNTTSATVMLLPTLTGGQRSVADDINGQSLIAGWSDIAPFWLSKATYETAFIYHADFGIYALPRGHFSNCHARALNERNQDGFVYVVGWCEGTQGKRAIRWNVRIKGSPGGHT